MTLFLKSGSIFRLTSDENTQSFDQLPVGTYIIKETPFGELFLETVDDFTVTFKRYGDNIANTNRIVDTFDKRDVSTGVLLAGEKGSGKSLLAKTVSMRSAELGYPTLIINEPRCGEHFNQFIQSINQPCVVVFDEFEKVYDSDSQEKILTLLDGVFPTKKLFILTANNIWAIDQHMRNRPGRIFYLFEFDGLSVEFINEYCEDNLADKQYIEKICNLSAMYDNFNFDMLKALVEEMNRYDEDPTTSLRYLNARPELSGSSTYAVSVTRPDHSVVPAEGNNDATVTVNPVKQTFGVDIKDGLDEDGDTIWKYLRVSPDLIVSIKDGVIVFVTADNYQVKLTKSVDYRFNFNSF